jgi:hypothetical protein
MSTDSPLPRPTARALELLARLLAPGDFLLETASGCQDVADLLSLMPLAMVAPVEK